MFTNICYECHCEACDRSWGLPGSPGTYTWRGGLGRRRLAPALRAGNGPRRAPGTRRRRRRALRRVCRWALRRLLLSGARAGAGHRRAWRGGRRQMEGKEGGDEEEERRRGASACVSVCVWLLLWVRARAHVCNLCSHSNRVSTTSYREIERAEQSRERAREHRRPRRRGAGHGGAASAAMAAACAALGLHVGASPPRCSVGPGAGHALGGPCCSQGKPGGARRLASRASAGALAWAPGMARRTTPKGGGGTEKGSECECPPRKPVS